jgi:hypothetical protein
MMIVLKASGLTVGSTSRVVALALLMLSAVVLVAAGTLVVGASPAEATTTFTVNKTGDSGDRNLSDARCDISTNNGSQCTLRAAIEESNDTAGADTIEFDISGAAKTIKPASQLPTMTDTATIDGYTQQGASPNTLAEGNDAVLKVKLNGTNAGADANGLVISASDSTVKGLVINRFGGDGIQISAGFGATGNNKVEGNFIGTTADGSGDLGNDRSGVDFFGADNNTVGGIASGAGNRIAHYGEAGVLVTFSDDTGNNVLSNSIFSNGGLGMDLGSNGVATNDTDDPDTGANNLQNFPVLSSAIRSNTTGVTTISGTLNSTPSLDFVVQCFLTDGASVSDHGEGSLLLDTTVTTTDANGDGGFFCHSSLPTLGQVPEQTVSATATNILTTGDTSEFSLNVGVSAGL